MITLPNDELSEEEKLNAISLTKPLSIPKNQGGNQQSFGPIAPRPPGFVEELGTRAKGRAMEGILNEGQSAIMKGFAAPSAGAANAAALSSTPATMGMAGPSLGAGVGASAAIPYVGAALAADELLGFGIRKKVFGMSDGGQVNPSASQYSSGGEVSYAAGGRYEIPHPGPGNSQSDLLKGYDSYLSGFAPASNGMPNMALNFDDWKASVMSANAIRFSDGGQVVPQYYGGGEIQGYAQGDTVDQVYAQGDFVDPNELLDEIELEQKTIDSEYIVNDYNSTLEATAGRVLPPLGVRINPAGQPQSILPQHNIYNPNTAPFKGLDEYT